MNQTQGLLLPAAGPGIGCPWCIKEELRYDRNQNHASGSAFPDLGWIDCDWLIHFHSLSMARKACCIACSYWM